MSTKFLQMEKISKIYGNGIYANREIDFDLNEGEIHALVGENGAGKTTLMKILFGMEKPSSGRVLLRGNELQMNSSKDAIANGIGMVHQHFMLVDSFTVAQNITLGMEPKKGLFVDEAQSVAFTRELGEKYNLKVDPNARVGDLPVGVKQKIEILKALARGAKILILDEPTAVLTPQETDQLFEELINLKKQGHTIIFISHKIKEIKKISDRVTIMRNGENMGIYNTADVSEQEISNKIVGWEASMELERSAAQKGDVFIRVKDLSYHGGATVPILSNVNFTVRGGTILGVAGVQGNGQVELVELMTRNRHIEQGLIEINGHNIEGMSVKALRDTSFGYVPEDRLRQGACADGSIGENIISNTYQETRFSHNGLLNSKNINDFSNKAIAEYEIKCYGPQQKISMLSGGNMQKVVVARECEHNPQVLIAEQPTRGVDIGAAHIIHQKIMALRDAGSAVLLVSADLGEVMKVCDSLIVLYDGEVVAYFEDISNVTEEELGLCMLGLKKHDKEQIGRAFDEQ